MKDSKCKFALTLKGPGGGGGGAEPPASTLRAVILRVNFFPRRFHVLRNLCRYFQKNRAYGSKVTQHYQTLAQNVKIFWICVHNMENGFLCQNSILSSKMQYLLSLQLKSLLYLLIFNTQTIPYKNSKIHKSQIQRNA